MNEILEQQFSVSFDQQTLVDCLAENTPFSKQQLKQYLQKGAVWLQTPEQSKPTRIRRAKKTLSIKDKVFFYYNQQVLNTEITPPKLIADHLGFSVWYKPKGVLCQGSKWADHTTINRWIEMEYRFDGQTRPAMIVHRLDKATDGLILIAHNHQFAKILTNLFTRRKIIKHYHARVKGKFQTPQTFQTPIDGKTAISHVSAIDYNRENNTTKVLVKIDTGRKHQIRKHLSEAGFPIVGDRLYDPETNHKQDLQLTAVYLSINIDGEDFEFELDQDKA